MSSSSQMKARIQYFIAFDFDFIFYKFHKNENVKKTRTTHTLMGEQIFVSRFESVFYNDFLQQSLSYISKVELV